ncbi:hypothetical protein BD413DRAFT_609774 [Trametes elegans]|nr:hypothetical protein BD413DRAFT_609774 [Trametes elegans]
MLEKKTFYGQLRQILVLNLGSIPSATPPLMQPMTLVLGVIRQAVIESHHNTLDIHYYKKMGALELVDITTVQLRLHNTAQRAACGSLNLSPSQNGGVDKYLPASSETVLHSGQRSSTLRPVRLRPSTGQALAYSFPPPPAYSTSSADPSDPQSSPKDGILCFFQAADYGFESMPAIQTKESLGTALQKQTRTQAVKQLASQKVGVARAYIDTGKAKLDSRSQTMLTQMEEVQDTVTVEDIKDDRDMLECRRNMSPKPLLLEKVKGDNESDSTSQLPFGPGMTPRVFIWIWHDIVLCKLVYYIRY